MSKIQIPVESTTLANGLRVVVSPDHSAPVATVGVYYQIGFRLEPRGRSGFAHLFEHMMFQGSEHAGKMEHIRLINSSGGVLNGSTSYDFTNYYESMPSNALERVLWLEADRMSGLKVNEENLRNQRDVVKEEVRVNVLNQPYGGFPWLDLPPIAFRNWPNAHNFYGDFSDLDAATLTDVQKFFHTYYTPSNSVLLMLGDVEPGEGFALARRYFEEIPSSPRPLFADTSEAPQTEERRGEVPEKLAQIPALAIGYQVPSRCHRDWYAAGILDSTLHGGRAGRIYRSLVLEKQMALDTSGGIHYSAGNILDYNGPTQMVTSIYHKPEYSADATIAAFDAAISDLHDNPLGSDEIEQIKVKFRSDYFSMLEGGPVPRFGLMHALACFMLFDNNPQKVNTVLDGFLAVTAAEVQTVAQRYLRRENRAIVIRRPSANGMQRGMQP